MKNFFSFRDRRKVSMNRDDWIRLYIINPGAAVTAAVPYDPGHPSTRIVPSIRFAKDLSRDLF